MICKRPLKCSPIQYVSLVFWSLVMTSSCINNSNYQLLHHDHPNQHMLWALLASQLCPLLEICSIKSPLSALTPCGSFTSLIIVCSFTSRGRPNGGHPGVVPSTTCQGWSFHQAVAICRRLRYRSSLNYEENESDFLKF